MVFLNGFNLLPVLPLDGGWNLHAILFSRHVLLDAGFRLVAALLLLVAAVFLHQQFLIYLAIAMLIALPAAVRIALVARRLRREGLAASSLDSQSISEGTARRIIAEIRNSFPKQLSVKNRALITLQIFESLNARPAGWGATIALGGAHLAGFAVSLAAASMFFGAGGFASWQSNRQWAEMPQNTFACGSTLKWRGSLAGSGNEPHITFLGTFSTHKRGEEAFRELTSRVPSTASAMLFGQTIFLTLPDDAKLREDWEAKLRPAWPDLHVLAKSAAALWTLVCTAPDERTAKAIESEVRTYFAYGESQRLIPPWSTKQRLTDAERNARTTFSKIQEIQIREYNDRRRWLSAERKTKRSDGKAVESFRERIDMLRRQAAGVAVREVARGADRSTDLELVKLYEAWVIPEESKKRTPEEATKIRSQMRERMGMLPLGNGVPILEGDSALSGLLLRTGALLRFNWIAFKQTESGLPALADWLCAKKCSQIRYRLERIEEDQDEDDTGTADESE